MEEVRDLLTPVFESPTDYEVELSIAMPCYNEEAMLPTSIPPLCHLLDDLHINHEVILVENGSRDGTGAAIDRLAALGHRVRKVVVERNQGYGHGMVEGLRVAKGRIVCFMCADGQVAPEDVVRTYLAIRHTPLGTYAKVRRITRNDGFFRWTQSRIYNALFLALFGVLTTDVNATPKVFHASDYRKLELESKDWFIDAEVVIKAKALRWNVVEVPVSFAKRTLGKSKVHVLTALEFVRNMFRYRYFSILRDWRRRMRDERNLMLAQNLKLIPRQVVRDE